MTYVFGFLACVTFIELFLFLDLRSQARAIVAGSHEAFGVLTASGLGDDEKETYVRSASLQLFRSTAAFTMKLLLIGAVLYGGYRSTIALFPGREASLARDLVSPGVVLTTTIAALCYIWMRNAVRRQL